MTTKENTPITDGFEPCDLSHLSLHDQTTVAVMLARVFEQGRRYGAFDAVLLVADGDFEDADAMVDFLAKRHDRSFDSADTFYPDGPEAAMREPVIEQLFARFPELKPLFRREVELTGNGWSEEAATKACDRIARRRP